MMQLVEKPFASGGEGAIYKVTSAPSHLNDVCVKLYHTHVLNEQREERIKYMVSNPPSQIRGDGFLLGWPMDYVTDADGKFLGFVMPLGFSDSMFRACFWEAEAGVIPLAFQVPGCP